MAKSDLPDQLGDPAKFILHLTDFSPSCQSAFEHALRLALAVSGELTVMHVDGGPDEDWHAFPSFRQTLQRWGLLAADAPRADVAKLGITVKKVSVQGSDVAHALADYGHRHPIDLLVLGSEQRGGLAKWFQRGSADSAALKAGIPALFVPAQGRRCVAEEDGKVTMRHVLVPVDHQPSPEGAIDRGLRALAAFGDDHSVLTLLHVGSESSFPQISVPRGSWQTARAVRNGRPAAEILAAAEESDADLLIMVTQGTHGVLDVLRGTTTEQVLQKTLCPLLSVPADY